MSGDNLACHSLGQEMILASSGKRSGMMLLYNSLNIRSVKVGNLALKKVMCQQRYNCTLVFEEVGISFKGP